MTPTARHSLVRLLALLGVIAALWAAPAQAQLIDRSGRDEDRKVPETMSEIQLSFAPVVKTVAPAVVNVYAQRVVRQRTSMLDDPFFRRFFGRAPDMFGMPRERVQQSLGSGVIVREDGILVTNFHVVKDTQELTIALADRREFDAEILLADERTDLAVLKIDAEGEALPTVEFSDSDDLEVGDLVLALGNPFGVGQTVTSGIVSAVARTQVGISDYRFFIQTDAAINPGNSGGALVATDGALVGINTAIFSRSGGSNGIGFAVPSNMVRLVVDAAVTDGELQRPWFGAGLQEVTPDLAQSLGLGRRPEGVLVTELHPKGPAKAAGIQSGDVILSIGDFDVIDGQGVRYRLATQRLGSQVDVRYWRDGRERTVQITAEAPPEDPAPNETQIEGINPFAGAEVANLSPAFNEENGLDPVQQGVAVLRVLRRSYAARFIRPGDIIIEVNGREIRTVDELERELEGSSRSYDISVVRGGRVLSGEVRI